MMNRHTVTGLADRPDGRGDLSQSTSGSWCVWEYPFLENIQHVDFSTCVSLLNSLERTPQTRNITGFLLWEFHFQMSCHAPFCSITLLYGHSSAWKPSTKAYTVLLSGTSASTHSQVHFWLPGPTLCCITSSKEECLFQFLPTPKTWNPF